MILEDNFHLIGRMLLAALIVGAGFDVRWGLALSVAGAVLSVATVAHWYTRERKRRKAALAAA